MTVTELNDFLTSQGVGRGMGTYQPVLNDAIYELPTQEAVETVIGPAMARNFEKLGADIYEEEVNDCDDHALLCAGLVRLNHRLNVKREGRKTSFAFGLCRYLNMQVFPRFRHILCVYVTASAGTHALKFFEPQTMKRAELLEREIESIDFLYM